MRNWITVTFTILALLLPACGSADEAENPAPATPTEIAVATATLPPPASDTPVSPPTAVDQAAGSTPTAPATETPLPDPTATFTSTPVPDWLNNFGRTADNLMYLGNPNAPVTIIDFSDFM